MKFLFTGGGTGGHLYPALAVAREVARDPDNELLYVGIRGRAEERILGGDRRDPRIPLVFAMSEGFPGPNPRRIPGFLLKLGVGVWQASWHLLRFRPDLVFATGGYASAPAVFAAWGLRKMGLLKTRIIIQEQNAHPGLMNRKAAQMADLVALTYPASVKYLPTRKVQMVGYPVRRDLLERPSREVACRQFDLDPERPVLLVFGGSQGARGINRTLYEILPQLLADGIQVIHGYGTASGRAYDAGREHAEAMAHLEQRDGLAPLLKDLYRPLDYMHDIRVAYAASSLVVARAGAGAIFELVRCGLPTILIPKMGLPADHQVANARAMREMGAVEVVLERPRPVAGGFEEEVDTAVLRDMITRLIENDDARREMTEACHRVARSGVVERLVQLSVSMAGGQPPEYEDIEIPAAEDVQGGQEAGGLDAGGQDAGGLDAGGVDAGGLGAGGLDARGLEKNSLEENSDEQLIGIAARGDLDPEVERYLQYRCGAALAAVAWDRRNRGIKLAGLLRDRGQIPLLMHIEKDPRPARGLARLLGQKGVQNGFIRRNLAIAFGQIGEPSPEILEALVAKLDDNYWEVRVEAIRALARLDCPNQPAEWAQRVLGFLKSRSFEEVMAAVFYWQQRQDLTNCRDLVFPLLNHDNVRVREYTLKILAEEVRARRLPASPLKDDLKDIMVTTTWFAPGFPLKNNLRDLGRAIEEVLGS